MKSQIIKFNKKILKSLREKLNMVIKIFQDKIRENNQRLKKYKELFKKNEKRNQ